MVFFQTPPNKFIAKIKVLKSMFRWKMQKELGTILIDIPEKLVFSDTQWYIFSEILKHFTFFQ